MTEPMVVLGRLDLDARRLFISIASGMIDSNQEHIESDCSKVDALDEQTLGMLVTVARNAQRRGQGVIVDAPSERVRHDLDDAGVGYLFAKSQPQGSRPAAIDPRDVRDSLTAIPGSTMWARRTSDGSGSFATSRLTATTSPRTLPLG